jgi:hypothetical protein
VLAVPVQTVDLHVAEMPPLPVVRRPFESDPAVPADRAVAAVAADDVPGVDQFGAGRHRNVVVVLDQARRGDAELDLARSGDHAGRPR